MIVKKTIYNDTIDSEYTDIVGGEQNKETALSALIQAQMKTGGGGGTMNYNNLANRPSIGGVLLEGNKTVNAIGAIPATAKGTASGVAPLNASTKVDNSYLNLDTTVTSGSANPVTSDAVYSQLAALSLFYYPVGSYYETFDSTFDPNTAFGGTWTSETLSGAEVVDSGTDGIWTYRKYSDGRYDAWYEGNINLNAGTSWAGGFYYHKSSSTLTYPSFSQSVTALHGAPSMATLSIYCGCNTATGETYWANAASGALSNIYVRLDVHGTWKTVVTPQTMYRWHRTA